MSDGCYFNICGDGVRTQLVWLDLCLFILIVTIVAAVGTGLFLAAHCFELPCNDIPNFSCTLSHLHRCTVLKVVI